ncbi:Ap-1 complex-associated regulatory protein-like isoform x1 [Plakobranchus ocellatus]|uniref:Ap-1 complex-associated regulatory protein-like isoform x1 n=1 Tax=Plakobranchus ocellatus TaxID=259542 RepID=A0AAV4A6R4_9GAST|nr:Ap-1 complex-associated regulatory protein-like isoform x1 [Plakobranchus ocellatus]
MGNCIHRCFGVVDRRRRYLRSKYEQEQDFSIEFENLMDEESNRDEMTRLLTERERHLLNGKQFDALVSEQARLDIEVDQKLANQEQELEREEEAFYEAKREAARIARLNKEKEKQAKNNPAHNKSWANEDEWEIAGGEDDFEVFLANVKARSLATRSQVRNGSGDGHSSSSSNAPNRDKTEGSSLDMEWDHEAGMSPHRKPKAAAHTSMDSLSKQSTASPMHSSDLEWDPEFVSADDNERLQLISSAAKRPVTNR